MPIAKHRINIRDSYPCASQIFSLAQEFRARMGGQVSSGVAVAFLDFYSDSDFEAFTKSAEERGFFEYSA